MRSILPKSFATATGAAALLALAAGYVPAQAQEMTPEPTPPAATEVDDATLRAFAQASLDVETVITEWSPRIQEAEEGTAEAEQLREQANQEIVEAVQDNGLDVETYNQLYQIAQADPEIATTIQRYRQELQ